MTTAINTVNGYFPKDTRSAVELYLPRGLAPIPVPARSKNPGYEGWEDLRVTTNMLDRYFPPGQARNVGILNGRPSGNRLDVDLDCPEALRAAPKLLPTTGWVFGRKSAPRSHRIYTSDRPLTSAQIKYTDLDGKVLVELRGDGGMTIYPPSLHEDSGELVYWDEFGEPADVDLGHLRRAVAEVAVVSLLARHWPEKGTRQDAYLALSGGLIRNGWNQDEADVLVNALAAVTGDEEAYKRSRTPEQTAEKLREGRKVWGWPKLAALLGPNGKELVRRVREWLGFPSGKGSVGSVARHHTSYRPLPEYRPLPVNVFPEPLRAFITEAAAATGTDTAYTALPAMVITGGCVGTTRSAKIKSKWREPSVFWGATVAPSGRRKSPGFDLAFEPLADLQDELFAAHEEAVRQYENERQAWLAKPKDERGVEPKEPQPAGRLFAADTTIERLAELIQDNPRGQSILPDELDSWFQAMTRYKGKSGGTDRPHWLTLYHARTLAYDRKTGDRRTIYVRRAAASVFGTIQPAVMGRAFQGEGFSSGLAARLLLAAPPKVYIPWRDDDLSLAADEDYRQLLRRLLGLTFAVGQDGRPRPVALDMEPGARAEFIRFYNATALRIFNSDDDDVNAADAKLEAYAVRLALLFALVEDVTAGGEGFGPIRREHVQAGIELAQWFGYEARRVYALLAETEEDRTFRQLVEFVRNQDQRGKPATARLLQRSNQRKYPSAEHARAALDALVDVGRAEW